jgi:chemotaxis family two-component system sensor kinase Cph1
MSAKQVDLTNCDQEPIHIPGKVQSHGFLIAVHAESRLVTYISENIHPFITNEPAACLGKPIEELERHLDVSALPVRLDQVLSLVYNSAGSDPANPFFLKLGDQPYNLIAHLSGSEMILEFEPETSDLALDMQKAISRSVSGILSAKDMAFLLQNTAQEIKNIIRYDRVMIYKFGEDGHGEVVSEAKNEDLEPFLGLHYPASDIPKQARELYKINLTRIIADVNSESAGIITNKAEGIPLDMTVCELRAVSPIHIQYLKNMGVASSFSISLIAHKELWGLIACHNYSPRFINYKARDASKIIGQILSSTLEYRQEEQAVHRSAAFSSAANELANYIEKEDDLNTALTGHHTTIRDMISATGAAFVFDRTITRIGLTPDEEQIKKIVEWLSLTMPDPIFSTHRLPEIFHPAMEYSNVASGLMACMLSKELNEWIIWFKPEQLKEINWAGNPDKIVSAEAPGLLTISPRKSFESWTELVKNTSEKWDKGDLAAVIKIREQIIYTINRRANEIRLLNDRLKLAYEELDTFSYTISHDLRSPLSSVRSYSELLATTNKSLDEPAKKTLGRIIFCADKMDHLITEVLNYSKLGRVDLETSPIDMANLLQEIRTEVTNDLQPASLEFHIGDTPPIQGDPVMINQVFTNLINNAVKYSARSKAPKVRVEGVKHNHEIIYSVSDNGIGIDINYHSHVFELFKRMDNVKDFAGTGVGLAIVKRIVEKHKARIWFDSTLGAGTVFNVAFAE